MARKQGKVLINQVRTFSDSAVHLYLAKRIQHRSFSNMINLVKYYAIKRNLALQDQLTDLQDMLEEIKAIDSMEELMLHEARFKKSYYQCLAKVLEKSAFEFERRSKRPPHNSFNAMLSYGNNLTYATVLSLIDQSQIVPELAIIHSTQEHGATLQYDLSDIYKPVLVDRLILRLIRRGEIHPEHFDVWEETCLMNKKAPRFL